MADHLIDASFYFGFDGEFLDTYADELANQELSQIKSPIDQTDLFISAWTERYINHLTKIFEIFISKNFKSITILIDSNIEHNYQKLLPSCILENCKIIPLHIWPWWCRNLIKQEKSDSDLNWNTPKGLLRTGRLNRNTRIQILKLLYDQNLLNDIVWTFPYPESQKLSVLEFFADKFNSIPKNFQDFYNYCSTYAIVDANAKTISDIHPQLKNVIPMFSYTDLFISSFKHANYSIISDTATDDLIEKTFMTMLHKHPFLMLNKPTAFKKLKKLGFKTFENFLPYNDYGNVEDDDLRFSQIVENIRAFPEILQIRKEEILTDVQHNYDLCINLASETDKLLKKLSPCLTADNLVTLKVFTLNGIDLNKFIVYKNQEKALIEQRELTGFLEYYERIRGHDWPDIQSEDEFMQLPVWIQDECRIKFNFPRKLINRKIIEDYLVDFLAKS